MVDTQPRIYSCIIFIIIGLFFMILSLVPVFIEFSSDWNTTDGIVISSQVIPNKTEPDTSLPEIYYTYTVNGVNHTSNQIYTFGGYSSSGSYARDMVNQYPVGKHIIVYYNPTNPSESAIEKGVIMPLTYFGFFMGLIAFIVGLWLTLKARRES